MNMLARGARYLMDTLDANAGEYVYYQRGSQKLYVRAIPARINTEVQDETGVVMRMQNNDFVVRKVDLAGLDPPIPERGDTITYTPPEGTQGVYTVNGEDLASACYEEADSYGVAWRIHTKRERYAKRCRNW